MILSLTGAAACSLLDSSSVQAQSHSGAAPAPAPNPAAAKPARSPERLQQLLAQYDAAQLDDAKRVQLELAVDAEAGQRYATVSRLFWYTDIDAAKAAAKATRKPILSLRMLGELTNDLSCANSRFFRTALYADPVVSAYLRSHYILHWSTERAIPTVTIDMGDGRKIVRTTTGNGAHYILDDNGTPIDALPGLYAPTQFVAGLKAAEALALQLRTMAPKQRIAAISSYHQRASAAIDASWQKRNAIAAVDSRGRIATDEDVQRYIDRAQSATMAKAYVEVPDLQTIQLGPTPASIRASADDWRLIGQAMFGYGTVQTIAKAGDAPARGYLDTSFRMADAATDAKARTAAGWKSGPTTILSAPARQLFLRLRHALPTGAAVPGKESDELAIKTFEALIVADTAQNEFKLHRQVHTLFERAYADSANVPSFADINSRVYAAIFATPPSDPWMGLVQPEAFTGLPGDGIVIATPNDTATRTATR